MHRLCKFGEKLKMCQILCKGRTGQDHYASSHTMLGRGIKIEGTHLFLQTNWQEQSHSIKLVDAAYQILVLFEHRLPHSLAGNFRVEINPVLEEMEVGSAFQSEEV